MYDLAEPHYTVYELAEIWRVSPDSIRRRFHDEEGVIHLGNPNRKRRIYDPIRIPRSVAERVYRRLATKVTRRHIL